MRKKEAEKPENHERWLVSYADFITLLMVFFVVMYSMSKVDEQKFYQLAQSMSDAMGGTGNLATGRQNSDELLPVDIDELLDILQTTEAPPEDLTQINEEQAKELEDIAKQKEEESQEVKELKEIRHQLAEYFMDENLNDFIMMEIDIKGLVISLGDTVLFDPGSAVIKPQMEEILINIGNIISKIENYISIEGNTDDVPMSTAQYPSNWHLASARASNVMEFLIEKSSIAQERLSYTCYGEFNPLVPNDSAENRSKNRRVDVTILSNKYNEFTHSAARGYSGLSPEQILVEDMGTSQPAETTAISETTELTGTTAAPESTVE